MRVNEQGRSMIEMLGVLAIVGVLSVGGIAGYSKAMAKFKTNKVIDQINTISTNVRTLYSSQRNYGGLTTTQQITEQVNKEISPWLYSKGMKLAKNILKAASKIALKYDIDGDGKDEGSVTCDLDSILLLKEERRQDGEFRRLKIKIGRSFLNKR